MDPVSTWQGPGGGLSGGLIGEPGQALLPSQHRQHVEDAGRRGAAGQRHAERLRDVAEAMRS